MSQRPAMVAALKQVVQPFLRSMGFTGGFPHFRRIGKDSIDLVTFQFDRYGGGFIIEIARCPPTGIVTHWSESVPAGNTTAHDIHPDYRKRIQQRVGSGTDS